MNENSRRNTPLLIAVAVLMATQIGCTYWLIDRLTFWMPDTSDYSSELENIQRTLDKIESNTESAQDRVDRFMQQMPR